jgi:hypothetical protein
MCKYLLAVEVCVSQERASRAGEREHGQRHWNGNVDADLADVDLVSELASRGTVCGENSRALINDLKFNSKFNSWGVTILFLSQSQLTVSVGIVVNQFNGLIKRVSGENDQGRSEDLLFVTSHVRLHVSKDGRANEVAISVLFWHLSLSAVKQNARALLLAVLDDLLNTDLRVLADDFIFII